MASLHPDYLGTSSHIDMVLIAKIYYQSCMSREQNVKPSFKSNLLMKVLISVIQVCIFCNN